jgi:hypothetical protein
MLRTNGIYSETSIYSEHFDISFGYWARKAAAGVRLHLPLDGTNERLAHADFEPRFTLCKVVKEHFPMEIFSEFVFGHK